MPGRFTVSGPQEIRYSLASPEAYQPDMFIAGDPVVGFYPTAAPQELGFWGTTFRDKQINAATIESGNASTWVMNHIIDPLVPGEQRFVSLGAGMLMKKQFTGQTEEINGWKALSNRISPLINVSDIDKRIMFRDEDFDATAATDEWMQTNENGTLAQLAQREGFNLPQMLLGARNREHFVYVQNRILQHAQAMQNIRRWEKEAGTTLKWTSRISSAVGNYLLTDPSFAPSLFIGPGALNMAGRSVAVGSKVIRLAAPVLGGSRALATGRAVASALRAPAAVHAGLANAIGYRAAISIELGAYGGVWDLAFQEQRIKESEIIFDDPQFQQHFSWAELGLSVGIGGTLGFALAGLGGRRLKETRSAAIEAAGGNPSSPIRYSFDNWKAQGRYDGSAIRAQRAAATLLGDDFDSVAPYLDDAMLLEHGLHRFQVADVLEEMATALGGKTIPPAAVHRVLSDMLVEARKVRGIREELAEAFGGQLEQAALAEAVARAARELPQSATNEAVLRRAYELVPDELQQVEAGMARRAKQARPAAEGELDYWRAEARELQEIASRRSLTEAELDHMGTVGGKLQSLGDSAPFDGLAVNRSRRYVDGSIFTPFRARSGGKLTQAVQQAANERRLIEELVAKRSIGEEVRKTLKNARERLSRAEARIQSLSSKEASEVSTDASRIRDLAERYSAKPPRTKAEKFRALDEVSKALDLNANALLEDGTMIGRLLNGWGLGRLARRLAQQGTGIDQTVRSHLGMLREIAQEFDPSKLRVGDLDPTRTAVHRTVEDVRIDMSVRASEIVDEYRRLHSAGKFGTSLKVRTYMRARRDFDRQVIRHITGQEISSDPDVLRLAKFWKKHADEIGATGDAVGLFKQLDNFFPRRWNIGAILKNEGHFRTVLARHFLKKWHESDEVHLDTLVQMGLAERVLSDTGDLRGWRLKGQDDIIKALKRSDLEDDAAYLKALESVGEDGFTPMERAANKAKNNLTGDDSFEELPNGRIRRHAVGGPRSEADRILEEAVWRNPELEEFLDWRFLHGAAIYLQSTGFRVMNAARHQERWGIPGISMHDTLDWLEARISAAASAEDRAAWVRGIKTLREKLHMAEGRLPTVRDQTNAFGEWLGDVGTSAAGALYGSGIGQAVLTTEVMQAIFSRVYSPADFVRTIGHIFRVALPKKEMREQIQSLGLTVRQYRLHTLERLTGGAIHSEGFQFGLVPKLLAPWMDVFNTSVSALPGRQNRTAAGLRAWAANQMTVGGMDYFTQFARMLHVQSMLDETGRFWQAAEKTADLLRRNADDLDRVERAAREASLARGKTDEVARKAGARARFKRWVAIAREGGFGGNWQVAERMQRAGLLNPERLAALRKAGTDTGALKDTGLFRTMDYNRLMRYTAATKAEQQMFEESFTSLRNMMVDTIHKRVSEQNMLQAPTAQTSRTWLGRTQLAMTSFARSWYDNNILDMAQMPARAAVGMIGVYLFGEAMNRMLRDLWRGRSIEETLADIEADPDNFVARSLTNIPLLGAWSAMARPAADALTLDGKRQRLDTGESAAEGAIGSSMDMVFDAVHGISPLAEDAEVQTRTWRTAGMLMPGYRSWWATGLMTGLQAAGGPDLIIGDGRHRSVRRRHGKLDPLPDPQMMEVQTGPKFPEDLSFIYPQE